ncbi:MAG: ferritin [Sulfurimonas sp. RIFCSPHIGHO2_12_FULL_36_9]|uniref:non-heme ferritin n=1 Tax=unclassified Sulfurimonas TaxID=2623549 RepID=UPI0008C0ED24|nr:MULTISPECIES: non-heme ferritin [unclassified Sulfurimonas]OHD98525.1 MAG: ferritin [Sulfurimonas sp. RIFCSPHIGHO2_12_FULL_36_9]OHE00863.1 MAG: ferritin [Sulfurimonas sp. RIFCSPLOWO2_12_36_12]OHE08517.1 MAG: ferritin [Sulfurimonas sp. RIFCSPLOWO2_12_FULL_36_74]
MLTQKMIQRLNEQVNLEMYSSNIYLAMSAWCANRGLHGSANFFKDHSKEELSHAYKLFDYINETGATATIEQINKPHNEFIDLKDVFEKTYNHELLISKLILDLVDTALSEKDYSTFNFLQWYVSEQHEEEKLFKEILDKFEIIGMEGRGLFMIDREIAALVR